MVPCRSHSTGLVQDCLEILAPDEILKVGGAGHKVMLLMEGKAHAYVFPSPGCKKWDTCAPEAILHAMGGKLTDMKGDKYEYQSTVAHRNSEGVLATAIHSDHAIYQAAIPQDVKDKVKDSLRKK
jgi:3'(2'), 5'-bisphosphate nucleotidase